MLRSLYSGISSLRSHQTMLDVTGNNIANVNTTGFKSGRTQFEDTLSQVMMAAGAPQGQNGGTNPAQVGLGVQVSAITNDFGVGAAQQTGRALDMMIDGDGFFVVQSGGEQLYTRAGAFTLDAQGNLVTAGGAKVMGWGAVGGVVNSNAPLAPITLPTTTTMGAQITENVTFTGNLPSDADVDDAATTGVNEATVLNREIEVFDAAGNSTSLKLAFTKTDAGWDVAATAPNPADPTSPFSVGTISLVFGSDGALTTDPAVLSGDPFGAGTGTVSVDLAGLTGFADLTTVEAASQDGQSAGVLQSFSMNADGTLVGTFSNGFKQDVGQIALSSFTNMSGLEKAGGSMFRATVNSGDPQIGVAGTASRGPLTGGSLEMSNVDLSQEFTNLIVAQRGFQAGSRVITTSDELLQELVNLKR